MRSLKYYIVIIPYGSDFACVTDALNLLYRRVRGPAATQASLTHFSMVYTI